MSDLKRSKNFQCHINNLSSQRIPLMTIQYNHLLASSSALNFFRVMFRWKGSVWKAVVIELVSWSLCYQLIALVYCHLLSDRHQKMFQSVALGVNKRMGYIPLEFILGFFVNAVVKRWTDAFHNMGYLEDQAMLVGNVIRGDDDESRMMRRTIVRYLCLSQVLVFRDISILVRKRFPSYESIVKAGLMLESEKCKLRSYKHFENDADYGRNWAPINWAFALVIKSRQRGKIVADIWAGKLCDEIRKFKNCLQILCNYDWVPIPLAYPQFVILAVYAYFAICLLSRQFAILDGKNVHVTVPVITMLQYVFCMGWMKVATSLINPFGDDENDFECNYLIDKNLATCMCMVDDAYDDLPELKRDQFWCCEKIEPLYAKDAADIKINPLIGSAVRTRQIG
uniref:Bestrophin homolog n=3 Tax=Parascaris TaxID=6254 RepID=A0A915A913_PARUN